MGLAFNSGWRGAPSSLRPGVELGPRGALPPVGPVGWEVVWEAASLFEERSFQTLLEDVQQRVEAGCFPRVYFLHKPLMGLGRVVDWPQREVGVSQGLSPSGGVVLWMRLHSTSLKLPWILQEWLFNSNSKFNTWSVIRHTQHHHSPFCLELQRFAEI